MVDYSKWEKFDDEEEGQGRNQDTRCLVQTLPPGSKVRLGPRGYDIESAENSAARKEANDSSERKLRELIVNGAAVHKDVAEKRFYWRQDRYEVVLYLPVTSDVKGKDVAVAVTGKELSIRHRRLMLFRNVLRYPINTEDSDSKVDKSWAVMETQEAPLDFVIESCPPIGRCLLVTLKKFLPVKGAHIWWEKVFEDDDIEVDIANIKGRDKSGVLALQENYAAAFEQFQQKVRGER